MQHIYKVGDSVFYNPGSLYPPDLKGQYTVTRLLPPTGDHNQYRIQRGHEAHERVAQEFQLVKRAGASLQS
jgi:hypothetical protein